MTLSYTVDDLVSRVRRAAQLSSTNEKLTTDQIVAIADEEIQNVLWPALRSTAEDYGTTYTDVTVPYYPSASDPAGISGTVRIPSRAYSSTISAVYYVNAPGQLVELAHVELSTLYQRGSATATNPSAYVLRDDLIVLVPTPAANVTIRVFYERRPSRLVLTSAAAPIVPCTGGTQGPNMFSPVGSATLPTGAYTTYDVVSRLPQLGPLMPDVSVTVVAAGPPAEWRFYLATTNDLATTGIPTLPSPAGGTITSPAAYLCSAGETCVFPLPDAWWSAAVTQVAMRVCIEIGDTEVAAALEAQSAQRLGALVALQSNRARKQGRAVFDSGSPLRQGYAYRGRG